MADTTVLGIGELAANFKAVRADMEVRVSRVMVVAAGGILKKNAKEIALANGSRRTGAMIKNIVIKREKDAPEGTTQYHLGVKNGNQLTKKQKSTARLAINKLGQIVKRYADDPYYWRWVEQGHKIVAKADAGDKSYTSATIVRRLKNGKWVLRRREVATQSLRNRRAASMGSVAARPFIGPALEQGREEAIAAMSVALDKELAKALKSPPS